MVYISFFIIIQTLFLLFQYFNFLRLESFQYCELIFGSVFIIVFFGCFGTILTLDFLKEQSSVFNNSVLFATFYSIWFYTTKKLTNFINSDSNGVINY